MQDNFILLLMLTVCNISVCNIHNGNIEYLMIH